MRQRIRILTSLVAAAVLSVAAPAAQNREGIKVHGDWTIEVKNPDGTIVSRHEFKNALVATQGDEAIAGLLSRAYSAGRWVVSLEGGLGSALCAGSSGDRDNCYSSELPMPAGTERLYFRTLQVANPGSPARTTELTGSVTATFAGSIHRVFTLLQLCAGTAEPNLCGTDKPNIIVREVTSKTLPSPIAVAAGQIVQFKVVLSFS